MLDHLLQQRAQRAPEVRVHQHHREVLDLAGLDQRGGLEQLVQRAEAARQHHEGVAVLHQHHLAHEEVAERDPAVEVRVRRLLFGQHDVHADREADLRRVGLTRRYRTCVRRGALEEQAARFPHLRELRARGARVPRLLEFRRRIRLAVRRCAHHT